MAPRRRGSSSDSSEAARRRVKKRLREEEDLETFARQASEMHNPQRRRRRRGPQAGGERKAEAKESGVSSLPAFDMKQAGARSGFTKEEEAALEWKRRMAGGDGEMEDPLFTIQKARFAEDAPPASAEARNPLLESANMREFVKFQKAAYKKARKEDRKSRGVKKRKRRALSESSRSSSDSYRRARVAKKEKGATSSSSSRNSVASRLKAASEGRRQGTVAAPETDEFGRELREGRRRAPSGRERRRRRRRSRSSSEESSEVSEQFWDHLMFILREKQEIDEGTENVSIWEQLYGRRREAEEMGFDTRKGEWISRAGGVYIPPDEDQIPFNPAESQQRPVDMERHVMQKYFNDDQAKKDHDGGMKPWPKDHGRKKEEVKKKRIRISNSGSDDSSSMEFHHD